jgi:hypothetical protein
MGSLDSQINEYAKRLGSKLPSSQNRSDCQEMKV